MPIYEYRCPKCKREFELMRPLGQADDPAPCPGCGTTGEKLISVFASTLGFGIQVPKKQPFREAPKKAKARSKRSK